MSKLSFQLSLLKAAAHESPTDQSVALLDLVRRGTPYADLFFQELTDSRWLPNLRKERFFESLPSGEPVGEGRKQYRPHLALVPLPRFAVDKPNEVADLLLELKLPDNPVVEGQIMRCLAAIKDRDSIAKLCNLAVELSKREGRSAGVWVKDLLESWVATGAVNETLTVAKAYLLSNMQASINNPGGEGWLVREINREVFSKLTEQQPLEMAKALFEVLKLGVAAERQRQKGQFEEFAETVVEKAEDSEEQDYTGYWLEDFKTEPDGYREVEGTLASRLYLAASQVYSSGRVESITELDVLLRSDRSMFFARLRWQLYADYPELSLNEARGDVLARLPQFNAARRQHNYEFAQMLKVHAEKHKHSFLNRDEVTKLVEIVFAGPIDASGDMIEGDFPVRFRQLQLQPVASLFDENELKRYQELLARGEKGLSIETYKPIRAGGGSFEIVSVAPKEAEKLEEMSPPALWELMNTWKTKDPSARWENRTEESYGMLATKFAELVETRPAAFDPADKWWTNLKRPTALEVILARATTRLEKAAQDTEGKQTPSEQEWANWFGVAEWISKQRPIIQATDGGSLDENWSYSRIVVGRFIRVSLADALKLPQTLKGAVDSIVRELIEGEDPRLDQNKDGDLEGWLTAAINSARGVGLEALFELALKQKRINERTQEWMFSLIKRRLGMAEESPAIFALVGSRLRLLNYLFGNELKADGEQLIFPADRSLQKNSAVVAHLLYDQPHTDLLVTFPKLIAHGLDTLAADRHSGDQKKDRSQRDFGSRLGTQIAFYYWNSAFESDMEGEAALDRFFNLASTETRAGLIRSIARIFEKVSDHALKVESRVRHIWERRFSAITQADPTSRGKFDEEIAAFLGWLKCECFPFQWRHEHALKAIELLPKAPRSHYLIDAVEEIAEDKCRLCESLQILRALLKKPSDELRWAIQAKKLKPMVSAGLQSHHAPTMNVAEEVQDLLLTLGFFEFLEPEKE